MPQRRQLLTARLDALVPVFDAIRAKEGVSTEWSQAAIAEAVDGGETDLPHVEGERRDATDLPFVTVDPPGARDLDQALHLERHADGFRIFYAIADVGAHVVPGGEIDAETHRRAETVYCPDRRVGLHPAQMAEGYASLLPHQRTKAVLWTLEIGSDGQLGDVAVERAWVTSRRQWAYDELAASTEPDAQRLVADMASLGALRRAVLSARGAVSLPKPSQDVDVADDGTVKLSFRAPTPLEDDNAQVSLVTGMAAARLMLQAGVGVLRTMPRATAEALETLQRQAGVLGVEWPDGATYADVLATLDHDAAGTPAFLVAATALFRGAAWEPFDTARADLPVPANTEHGALAVPYAHVTAPLRRLVDRYGAEVCLAVHAGRPIPEWVRDALPTLGSDMIAGVRRASAVDRACIAAVESAVLADQVGEVFTGVALNERDVQLAHPAVVARAADDLPTGDEVTVRLVSADLTEGPRFELVGTD